MAPPAKMRKARASYNPDQKKFLAQQLNDRIDEWIAGASDARHAVEDKVLELAKADHSLEATDWTRNMIFNQFKARKAAKEAENKQ